MAKEPEQFDPYELGARNSDPTLGAFQPLPPAPNRFKPMTLLIAFLGLVLVIAFIQEGVTRNSPKLDPSCTTPTFALDQHEIRSGGVVKWTAVGPPASKVVFGIDTPTLPTTPQQGKLAGPIALNGCKASGRFGVLKPPGDYVITAFAVAPDGTTTTLGTQSLTVNSL